MTREQAIERLRDCIKRGEGRERNSEIPHMEADDILCDLLRALGYGDVVDLYDRVDPKWYG